MDQNPLHAADLAEAVAQNVVSANPVVVRVLVDRAAAGDRMLASTTARELR
ncbi:hypothetical protein [Mycobacterium sp. AT1]|uniref:hypothetical protein n=1 Tax=Mycobacterium sp. AT1 TaxID=1961706 RepID=UPI00130209D0|nr:hypothetical protein [Mycobacterium sp. AT1]